jgi:tight adherence protein C
MFPTVRLQSVSQTRFVAMSRQLPGVIDLMAMAMNAGSDFPGAMRRVVEGRKGVVAEELGQVLLALDLGITRTSALIALRERVPVSDVKDLVRVVLLADKKGSPLTEALSQQAKTSRMRRSVRAEEAAARAAVWMLVPLMLLMVCILILVLGPMMCTGVGL